MLGLGRAATVCHRQQALFANTSRLLAGPCISHVVAATNCLDQLVPPQAVLLPHIHSDCRLIVSNNHRSRACSRSRQEWFGGSQGNDNHNSSSAGGHHGRGQYSQLMGGMGAVGYAHWGTSNARSAQIPWVGSVVFGGHCSALHGLPQQQLRMTVLLETNQNLPLLCWLRLLPVLF